MWGGETGDDDGLVAGRLKGRVLGRYRAKGDVDGAERGRRKQGCNRDSHNV